MTESIPPGAEKESLDTSNATDEGGSWTTGRVVLGLAILVGLVLLGRSAGAYVPRFAEWVAGLGALGPIVFIAGYALATIAFVPGLILTLAAGAIFGLATGVVYVFVAAMLGSAGAFLIARHVARSAVEKRIQGDDRFAAVDRAIGREGRKIVFLLRLSPVFPFNLLNYALGLTQVSFTDYVIAGLGMIPGTLLYVYAGKVIGDVAAIAGGASIERGVGAWLVTGLGLVATLVVTLYVTRVARTALEAATGETPS